MHPVLAEGLLKWRKESTYTKPTDWVFASVQAKGRVPRAASTAGKHYLRPAAIKAGIIGKDEKVRWGWHNLRHTLASVVTRTQDLSTAQKLLRHTKQSTTEKYTHRVSQELIEAQAEFIAALKPASEVIQ